MTKILAISDQIDPRVYSDSLKDRYGDVDLVISCGDLSYMYLEYVISTLNKPLYFVHGNHDPEEELNLGQPRSYPHGGLNLHLGIYRRHGLLLAGVEGSIQYNRRTPYQYSQAGFWSYVLRLVPGLLYNRLRYGRFLDVFVSHAPPHGFHEGSDWTHQGIKAFRWLLDTFQPTCHLHGHIHLYFPDQARESSLGRTRIINAFQSIVVEIPGHTSRSDSE
ncbi:MAG: metallophosphoesterase [Anaerolineales bacterium]|jgi:Icc-related predicted phosphoesterase